MLKLFQINVVANQGSTGKIAEQIGRLAINKGWCCYLAYGRGNPSSNLELIRIGNDFEIKWHALQTRILDNHGLASRAATKQLIKKIESIQPDIIHLHNLHGYYLNYRILFEFLAKYGKPIVWTLHDCWAFTGHCAFFDFNKCDKWKTHCKNCPSKHSYPSSFFFDRSQGNYDEKRLSFSLPDNLTLVPVSEWLNGLHRDSFLNKIPSRVIHNRVDLDVFAGYCTPRQRTTYNIISVANNWSEPRKGFKDFLLLRERLPSEFIITLVGLKDKEVKQLPKGIIGITRTSNQKELASLYANADVFVLPTYEDNFPSVILESLASGTPVIVYNTGGCSEAVNHQVGMIVPQGDIDALIDAIMKMRKSPISSAVCRSWAESHFKNEDCFNAYFDLYNDLLSK